MAKSAERPLVVIIENDGQLADAMALLVHDWGFEAIPAGSATVAVRALGSRLSDVRAIIADYRLDDGFTGIKAATSIAKAIGHPVPTIMTTGHALLADHAGAFPVLSKPFDLSILRRWLDDHVNRTAATCVV